MAKAKQTLVVIVAVVVDARLYAIVRDDFWTVSERTNIQGLRLLCQFKIKIYVKSKQDENVCVVGPGSINFNFKKTDHTIAIVVY